MEFRVGETSEAFKRSLIRIIQSHPRARTRGWHSCTLPHAHDIHIPYPYVIEVDSQKIPLGSAEVRVIDSGGQVLIAPDLVYHYVADHHYLPPKEFIEAVIQGNSFPEITGV